ncbi:MAG: hypothetical protein Q9183_004810, partial [Haloplaca sp. 2 TL-2023]
MAEKIPDKLESVLHHEKLGTEPEWSAVEVGVHEDEIVERKWQGTQADQHDMRILGRVQVLRKPPVCADRRRNGRHLLGLHHYLFCLHLHLPQPSRNGFNVSIARTISLSTRLLTTVSGRSPTAGGQYHWVSEFSPRWCQKYLSYITGWVLAIGWQGAIVGLSFVAGTIVQGLIILNNPNYEPQQWHGTLLVIAAVAMAIAVNVLLSKSLPMAEYLILFLHVLGVFAICIPLLVMAPKNSARVALLSVTNDGGWKAMETAFMIGLLTMLSSMMGFDCAVHM